MYIDSQKISDMCWGEAHQHLTTQISKENIKQLPEYSIGHRRVILVEKRDVQSSVEEIAKSSIIGFDTESKPTFKKGETSEISLIQIATNDTCYLFHKNRVKNKFSQLRPILESQTITKVGAGLKSDKSTLNEHYGINLRSFVDTARIFTALGKSRSLQTGAKQMVAVVLNQQLKKSKRSCVSNWSKLPYDHGQLKYASEDAAAPLDCYQTLLALFNTHLKELPDRLIKIIRHNLQVNTP